MSLFGDLFNMGAHEYDDELFDLFVLSEMEKEEKRRKAEAMDQEYEEDDDDWGF